MSTQLRYAPHISLSAVGQAGQDKILAAKILLVGLGGLGCPVAQYLVGSGIGKLLLCDFDTVSERNLARQLLFTQADSGRLKTDVARERLTDINPHTKIEVYPDRVDRAFLQSALPQYDLLVDASDNYGTRLSINQACLQTHTPWVMGSCIRLEGQVILYRPANPESPCYRCTYGQAPETLEDCPGAGIFAPVAGMIGTAMAQLALAGIAGIKTTADLNLLDAEQMHWKKLKVKKNSQCQHCG